MEATLGSKLSSAELCRRNGWGPGTVLEDEGDEAVGPHGERTRIILTAIGDGDVLARYLTPAGGHEWRWRLNQRGWRRVQPTAIEL